MNKRIQVGLLGCFALGMLAMPVAAIDIALVPVGGVGNGIATDPGEVVAVEVWVSGWTPEMLRAIQATIDPASLTSGAAGELWLFNADADADGVCDPGNEPVCPTCGSADLQGMFIDACRADHFLAGITGVGAVDLFALRMAWVGLMPGAGAPDPGVPRYVGTYVFQASTAARGTFTLTLTDAGTFARNEQSEPLAQETVLTHATVTIRTGRCCHPDWTCEDDVTAIECVGPGAMFGPGLTCAEPCGCETDADCDDADPCTRDVCGDESLCVNEPRVYGDIAPCGGDGIVDLDDILAVLDAFAGIDVCPPGCP